MCDAAGNVRAEVQAGRNLRALRLARGWSQQEVADRMKAHGYTKWGQSTVWKTEEARRPLRVNELADLASLFDVGIGNILMPSGLPVGYPFHNGVPEGSLTLAEVERQLALTERFVTSGDEELARKQAALDDAAASHRSAQAEHDGFKEQVETQRTRAGALRDLRDRLLAGQEG